MCGTVQNRENPEKQLSRIGEIPEKQPLRQRPNCLVSPYKIPWPTPNSPFFSPAGLRAGPAAPGPRPQTAEIQKRKERSERRRSKKDEEKSDDLRQNRPFFSPISLFFLVPLQTLKRVISKEQKSNFFYQTDNHQKWDFLTGLELSCSKQPSQNQDFRSQISGLIKIFEPL